eukprot:UC4_evm4s1505
MELGISERNILASQAPIPGAWFKKRSNDSLSWIVGSRTEKRKFYIIDPIMMRILYFTDVAVDGRTPAGQCKGVINLKFVTALSCSDCRLIIETRKRRHVRAQSDGALRGWGRTWVIEAPDATQAKVWHKTLKGLIHDEEPQSMAVYSDKISQHAAASDDSMSASLSMKQDYPHHLYPPVASSNDAMAHAWDDPKIVLGDWQKLGISVGFLEDMLEDILEQDPKGLMTVHDFCATVIMPATSKTKCAYYELLLQETNNHRPVVNHADLFCCYAWSTPIIDLLEVILSFNNSIEPQIQYVWIDIFMCNQHQKPEEGAAVAWAASLSKAIKKEHRRMLVVFTPWYKPHILERTWCMYEILSALKSKVPVHMHLPQRESAFMFKALAEESEFIWLEERINDMVSSGQSRASIASDGEKLLEMIYKEFGSYHAADLYVKRMLSNFFRGMSQLQKNIDSASSDNAESNRSFAMTAMTLKQQAAHLEDLGKDQEAIRLYEQALTMINSSIGDKTSDSISSIYSSLGNIYLRTGKYVLSEENFQKALNIDKIDLGEYHPVTACDQCNTGVAAGQRGLQEKAIAHHKNALSLLQKCMGAVHPAVAVAHNNLGVAYDDSGMISEALEHYEKSLVISQICQGPSHPSVIVSHSNLGVGYIQQGEYAAALYNLKAALFLGNKAFGQKHLCIATTLQNLGSLHHIQGNDQIAMTFYLKALDVEIELLGQEHPSIGLSYLNMGCLHLNSGDHATAEDCLTKAMDIFKISIGEGHPDFVDASKNIGDYYLEAGNRRKALEIYDVALQLSKTIHGDGHPTSEIICQSIRDAGGKS